MSLKTYMNQISNDNWVYSHRDLRLISQAYEDGFKAGGSTKSDNRISRAITWCRGRIKKDVRAYNFLENVISILQGKKSTLEP